MELKGRFSEDYWKNEEDNYCTFYVEDEEIIEHESEIIKVKGEQPDYMNNNDVEAVCIRFKVCEKFPRGFHKVFPNLLALEINGCGLKTISREDLKGLENLSTLFLPSNELETLPSDLFRDMRNLKYISFANNNLKFLTSKLLQPIIANKLQLVNFKHNSSIDFHIEQDTFLGDNNYEALDVTELMKTIDSFCKVPVEEEFKDSIAGKFKELWATRLFSDVNVIVGSVSISVHKNILGVSSTVFAAMFQNDMKELRLGEIVIEDFTASAVEDFLKCLYTGEIEDEANTVEIFALAAKYNIQDLKTICKNIILKKIDGSNAIEILNLAHLYGSDDLEKSAFVKIQKTFPEIKFPSNLINKPEALKSLIEETVSRKRKILEAEEKFAKKVKLAENERAMTMLEAEAEYKRVMQKLKIS